jgi:hypothetical protein
MTKIRSIALLVVVGLAACTGGDDATPTVPSVTVATVPPTVAPVVDLGEVYFAALADPEAAGVAGAGAALPGSDAAIFMAHQAATRDLLGLPASRTLGVATTGFDVCEADRACVTYSAIVSDPASGQVTTFSIDGVPLTGRIVGAGPAADRDGVTARVGSAYRSISGDLLVLVEVDNNTDVSVEPFGFAAVFQTLDTGEGVEATGAWGAGVVAAGDTGYLLVRFASTELGGRLRFSGVRSDGLDVSFELVVPAPG